MLSIMRTTISLDDQLAKQVRRAAAARGISVSAFIAKTLDDALKRRETVEPPPFRLVTVRSVHPCPGVDLDRPRGFDARDDETLFIGRLSDPSHHQSRRRILANLAA